MIKIFFSKKNDKHSYVKIKDKYYSKKSIYSFFKKKSCQISSYNVDTLDNIKIIKINLKNNKSYVLYMLEDDYYYRKILSLLSIKFYKKVLLILNLCITVVLSKNIISSNYNVDIGIDVTLNSDEIDSDNTIDDLFSLYGDYSYDFIDDDFSYLKNFDDFNIEETIDSVFSDISSYDRCVYDGNLYLESIDNIDKDQLTSKLMVSRDSEYDEFDEESIKELVDNIYDYIEKMKMIDSNFSVKHFACSLEKLHFYKNFYYTKDEGKVYAFYTNYSIVYNLNDDDFSFLKWEHVTNHELTHLENAYCPCNINSNNYTFPYGVGIFSILSDDILYQPYDYSFLTETFAEEVASLMDGENIATYLPENQVTNNIEFALAINPNYEVGTILKNSIEQDPIGFYHNFPYLYDTKEELVNYVRMLKCYDYSLGYNIDTYIDLNDSDTTICFDFKNYAFLKHIELFYKNLYILNEESSSDISLYTEELINLFNCLMVKENIDTYGSVDYDLINSILIEKYNDFKNNYLVYKYPNYTFMDIYDTSSMEVGPMDYPSNVGKEKRAFIDLLIDNYSVTFGVSASDVLKK